MVQVFHYSYGSSFPKWNGRVIHFYGFIDFLVWTPDLVWTSSVLIFKYHITVNLNFFHPKMRIIICIMYMPQRVFMGVKWDHLCEKSLSIMIGISIRPFWDLICVRLITGDISENCKFRSYLYYSSWSKVGPSSSSYKGPFFYSGSPSRIKWGFICRIPVGTSGGGVTFSIFTMKCPIYCHLVRILKLSATFFWSVL